MEQFLCQQIEARVKNGTRSIVYTEAEMQNIFTLYDLKNSGNISKDQCREGKNFLQPINYICNWHFMFDAILALVTLANSEFHFTKAQDASIPTKVDMFTFMKICDDVLGIKPNWAYKNMTPTALWAGPS